LLGDLYTINKKEPSAKVAGEEAGQRKRTFLLVYRNINRKAKGSRGVFYQKQIQKRSKQIPAKYKKRGAAFSKLFKNLV